MATVEETSNAMLPAGWVWVRLDQVAEWGSGGTPKATKREYYGGPIPWAVIGDLNDGFVTGTAHSITERALVESSAKLIDPGTVMVAMYGSIGKLGIAAVPMATNQAIAFARPIEGLLDQKYLFWFLMHDRPKLHGAGQGATQRNISQTILRPWPVPLAPFAEQRRIVAAIEEHFSRIDAGVEALQRARRNLQRMRAAVLQEALTGRLVQQDREDEPVETLLRRLLDEHPDTQGGRSSGARLNKVPAPTNDEPLPHGWSWVKLEMVAITSSGGTPRRDRSEYFGGSIPWVKSGELRDGFVRETAEYLTDKGLANSSAQIVPRGTLMIALYGATVGKLGILDMEQAATNQAVCTIQPIIPEMRDYLWWVLRHRRTDLIFQGRGGAQPNISQEILRKLVLPLPPLAEQQRIVEQVERHWSVLRDVDAAIVSSVRRSDRLRRAVLSRAFQGRLVPQDPPDEPAAILLERIRVARTANGSKQHRSRRPSR